MAKDKTPPPMVQLTKQGLRPVDQEDAARIASDDRGTQYDLIKRTKRRSKQLRTYWKALHLVVQGDDRWPTAEHLHDALKLSCGYVRQALNLETAEIVEIIDSIAFDKMTQPEFQQYMDKAMKLLAETVGYDPLQFLHEGQAA